MYVLYTTPLLPKIINMTSGGRQNVRYQSIHVLTNIIYLLVVYHLRPDQHIASLQMNNDARSCDRNFYNCVKKPEKNSGLSTGLEPVTSRYRCDGSFFISYPQFTYDLFHMHHSLTYLSQEHMNPQLTCSQRQWLHSSVGRASHRYREVTGSSPVEVLNFFRLLYAIVKIAITTARIILHLISYPQFTYDLFHMHRSHCISIDTGNLRLKKTHILLHLSLHFSLSFPAPLHFPFFHTAFCICPILPGTLPERLDFPTYNRKLTHPQTFGFRKTKQKLFCITW